ncbi:MAG: helicase [Planctomycetes bacterium]|nr:helicase [Planctomycetota bacterium]
MLRTLRIGGLTKPALLTALQSHGVQLNDAARALFAHDAFRTSASTSTVTVCEITVRELGFADGATMPAIFAKAAELRLALCPLELGPHLRLHDLEPPEDAQARPAIPHRAPPGSTTVVSSPLAEEYEVPKGFYLRHIDGTPWLRGYWSDLDHVWAPADRLVFLCPADAAEAPTSGRLGDDPAR